MSSINVKDAGGNTVVVPITPIGQNTGTHSISVVLASDQGSVAVNSPNPSTVIANSYTVSTSVVALPSVSLTNGVVLMATSSNTGTVYVGGSTITSSTGFPLAAGQSVYYAVSNLSAIYVLGTNTSDTLKYTGN